LKCATNCNHTTSPLFSAVLVKQIKASFSQGLFFFPAHLQIVSFQTAFFYI
jgi:hypothetical protein